ncbi:MAG: WbqC family protein [Bacteroidetes bacterium]|nr:WbqC family protein [Bacteroidota bacterium]
MAKKLLIELPYLGNLAYYNILTKFDTILLEKHAFLQKSSYRNRCDIAGVNGKLTLSVPVVGGKDKKQYYKETKISYEHPWLKDHWNSLSAAYRRSPYFEFYEDKFEEIYHKKYPYLYELNLAFFELIMKLLKLNKKVEFTESYKKEYNEDVADFRSYFLPKKNQEIGIYYTQVFEDRNGFINNLSIVDLLFNEGPNATNLIEGI